MIGRMLCLFVFFPGSTMRVTDFSVDRYGDHGKSCIEGKGHVVWMEYYRAGKLNGSQRGGDLNKFD